MDPEAFLDMANQVIKLKMFPYFDIAHSLLCALAVREDLGAGAQAFSRKHPLACWLSTMLVIFAGGMVANGLLGEPILAPLKNSPQLYVATVVWYIVFYTPFDIGYKVCPAFYCLFDNGFVSQVQHFNISTLQIRLSFEKGWQILAGQSHC